MKKYEVKIDILNKDYVDSLIVALARQGYAPYINESDNVACFTITNEELQEVSK